MSKRRKNLEIKIGSFIKEYTRKRNPGMDPNDRCYDRDIERKIKRLPLEELNELLNGNHDDEESSNVRH